MCKNSDWQLQEWLEQQNDFRMSVNIFCQVQTFFFLNPITKNWHSSETSVFSVCSVSMIPIQKHMNLQRANILSTHPISLSLPLCFPGIHPPPPPRPPHTQAHARQINLRGLDWWHHGPLCWLRCCQKWWVIGKLCSAATLTAGCWCTLSMLIFSCCHSGTTQHASVTRRHSEWQQVSPPEWRMRPVDLRLQLFWSIILTSIEKH